MPSRARPRWLPLALSAALLLALLGIAPAPAAGAPPARPGSALVLRGGSPAADAAVAQALEAAGFAVTLGPETGAFEADKQELRDVDLVVLLANTTPATRLPRAGAQELARFVEQGGGLLVGQWSLLDPQIQPLMPALHCGFNTVATTTFARVAPNPTLDANVPASFPISLTALSGSEGCLQARDDVAVLYRSSNGGGRADAVGLAAWNVGKGRVAAFSTLLGVAELQSTAFRTLFQNTAAWLATFRDTTPPRIRSFTVEGAGGIVGQREVQISISANDSGGAGLGGYFLREYGFSGDLSNGWSQEATTSGWQPLQQPGTTFTWTLSPKIGVRYLQVFVTDRAGNVARSPAVAMINYRPATVSIGLDELHIYRIAPALGSITSVRMDAVSGNPDLYVFGPNVSFTPESDNPVEQTSFTATAGVYQVEVAGHVAGSYSLAVTAAAGSNDDDDDLVIDRRPRMSVSAIFPPQPAEDPSTLPPPSVDPTAAADREELFLPLLRR